MRQSLNNGQKQVWREHGWRIPRSTDDAKNIRKIAKNDVKNILANANFATPNCNPAAKFERIRENSGPERSRCKELNRMPLITGRNPYVATIGNFSAGDQAGIRRSRAESPGPRQVWAARVPGPGIGWGCSLAKVQPSAYITVETERHRQNMPAGKAGTKLGRRPLAGRPSPFH